MLGMGAGVVKPRGGQVQARSEGGAGWKHTVLTAAVRPESNRIDVSFAEESSELHPVKVRWAMKNYIQHT